MYPSFSTPWVGMNGHGTWHAAAADAAAKKKAEEEAAAKAPEPVVDVEAGEKKDDDKPKSPVSAISEDKAESEAASKALCGCSIM